MKKEEQAKARKLRNKGVSLNVIAKNLGVSKSSVSIWVQDIILTESQKERLSKNGHTLEAIEKRRKIILDRGIAERKIHTDNAIEDIKDISDENLKYIGIALYWGEGSKTQRNRVEIANSDPRIIKIMILFFNRVCKVPNNKIHGHLFLHPHLDTKKAEKYWSEVSGIPLKRFQKTTQAHNKTSKNKKDSLPNGTFTIGVYDTKLFLKIMGWVEGVHRSLVKYTD